MQLLVVVWLVVLTAAVSLYLHSRPVPASSTAALRFDFTTSDFSRTGWHGYKSQDFWELQYPGTIQLLLPDGHVVVTDPMEVEFFKHADGSDGFMLWTKPAKLDAAYQTAIKLCQLFELPTELIDSWYQTIKPYPQSWDEAHLVAENGVEGLQIDVIDHSTVRFSYGWPESSTTKRGPWHVINKR